LENEIIDSFGQIQSGKLVSEDNTLYSIIIWIGLCHRHCIENIKKAIKKYSDEVDITDEKAKNLLDQMIKVLKNSTSSTNMLVRINRLTDEAFNHPLLKSRIKESIVISQRFLT